MEDLLFLLLPSHFLFLPVPPTPFSFLAHTYPSSAFVLFTKYSFLLFTTSNIRDVFFFRLSFLSSLLEYNISLSVHYFTLWSNDFSYLFSFSFIVCLRCPALIHYFDSAVTSKVVTAAVNRKQ